MLPAMVALIGFASIGCEEMPTDSASDTDTTSNDKNTPTATKLGFVATTEETDSGMNVLFIAGRIPEKIPVLKINQKEIRAHRENNYLYWQVSNVDTGSLVVYKIEYEGDPLAGSFEMPRPVTNLICNETPCPKDSLVRVTDADSVVFSWSDSNETKYIYSYAYEDSNGVVEKWDILTTDTSVVIPVSDSLHSPIAFTLAQANFGPITSNREPDVEEDYAFIYHDIRGSSYSTRVQLNEISVAEQEAVEEENSSPGGGISTIFTRWMPLFKEQ